MGAFDVGGNEYGDQQQEQQSGIYDVGIILVDAHIYEQDDQSHSQ